MKFKDWIWIIVGFGIIAYGIYKIAFNVLVKSKLKDVKNVNVVIFKAIIINEKNYMGNQPVRPHFTFSYKFEINGKAYTGNSHDTSAKPGDTIQIKYVKNNPAMSLPLRYNE